MDIGNVQTRDELFIILHNPTKDSLVKIHQIHLVHCQDDVFDSQQTHNKGMTPGLCENPPGGINQDDGQIGCGCPRGHVPGVLFVSGRIGNDKFSLVGGKIAVCHINSNPLLPLGFESIQQQGIIYLISCVSHPLTVPLQGG